MGGIFSLLGLDDGDRSYINVVGMDRVFTAATEYLSMADAEANAVYAALVSSMTEDSAERYKLPGGGRMQESGQFAANAANRPTGGWDVGYPLKQFEEPVAENDVEVAYMTVADVNLALESIRIRNINQMRYQIMNALYRNTSLTWQDKFNPRAPTITIKPLANGDADLYPPVIGSEAEATETHYIVAGYTAINDSNNPLVTGRNHLEHHTGTPTGFGNVVAFVNSAQAGQIADLSDFDEVTDIMKRAGANRDEVTGVLPQVPGRIIGRSDGVWISEWNWTPASYVKLVDLDSPAPLKMRVDQAGTGLTRGLHLVAETGKHPLMARQWRNRYGFGVGNRLNGVIIQLKASGSYDIPAAWA